MQLLYDDDVDKPADIPCFFSFRFSLKIFLVFFLLIENLLMNAIQMHFLCCIFPENSELYFFPVFHHSNVAGTYGGQMLKLIKLISLVL